MGFGKKVNKYNEYNNNNMVNTRVTKSNSITTKIKKMSEKRQQRWFVVFYVSMVMGLLVMSSCGSSKRYHIGTGVELEKSRCTGKYLAR